MYYSINFKKIFKSFLIFLTCISLLFTMFKVSVSAATTDFYKSEFATSYITQDEMYLTIDFYLQLLDANGNPVANTPVIITVVAYETNGMVNNISFPIKHLTITNSAGKIYAKLGNVPNYTRETEGIEYSHYSFFISYPASYGVSKTRISNLTPDNGQNGNFYYESVQSNFIAVNGADSPDYFWLNDGEQVDDFMSALTSDYDLDFNHTFIGEFWHQTGRIQTGFLQLGQRNSYVQVQLLEYTHLYEVVEYFVAFDALETSANALVNSKKSTSSYGSQYQTTPSSFISNDSEYTYYGYSLFNDRSTVIEAAPDMTVTDDGQELFYFLIVKSK